MAFVANLENTAGGTNDDRGIFFFDDAAGLLQVVREGDAFLGSTIVSLGLLSDSGGRDGFNNSGQVAYSFGLADDRRGFARWNSDGAPPTPTPTPNPAPATPPAPSADTIPPELAIRGRKTIETLRKRVVIRGTASDASGIAKLDVKARGAKVQKAKVLSGDRFKVVLRVSKDRGRVIVKLRAIDDANNRSKSSKLRILRR